MELRGEEFVYGWQMGWEERRGAGDQEFISISCKAQDDTLLCLFAFVKNTFVIKLSRQLHTGEIGIRSRKEQGIHKPYCRAALAILKAVGPQDWCWPSCRWIIELATRQSGSCMGSSCWHRILACLALTFAGGGTANAKGWGLQSWLEDIWCGKILAFICCPSSLWMCFLCPLSSVIE